MRSYADTPANIACSSACTALWPQVISWAAAARGGDAAMSDPSAPSKLRPARSAPNFQTHQGPKAPRKVPQLRRPALGAASSRRCASANNRCRELRAEPYRRVVLALPRRCVWLRDGCCEVAVPKGFARCRQTNGHFKPAEVQLDAPGFAGYAGLGLRQCEGCAAGFVCSTAQ
jgi:hypothetical protein